MLEALLEQLKATTWIEWLGMLTGIAGIWLSIKERVSAWFFFIACYICYIWISYEYELFAFLVMNAAFAGVAIYGLFKWSKGQKEDDSLEIKNAPKSCWIYVPIILAAGTLGIGYLLGLRGEATLPYLDAFAACSGFVAQWMLSRKYAQNWLLWLASDTVYVYIFIKNAYWPSVILFGVFIFLAIKGWRDWSKKLNA